MWTGVHQSSAQMPMSISCDLDGLSPCKTMKENLLAAMFALDVGTLPFSANSLQQNKERFDDTDTRNCPRQTILSFLRQKCYHTILFVFGALPSLLQTYMRARTHTACGVPPCTSLNSTCNIFWFVCPLTLTYLSSPTMRRNMFRQCIANFTGKKSV